LLNSKNKIRIFIADKINLSGLKYLPSRYFIIDCKFNLSNTEILKNYNDYDVLAIRSTRKIDRHFIEKCNFKIIASCTKGLDHIDLKNAERKKIKIINSEVGNTVSAAEHTFALILAIVKKIFTSDKLVRSNKFSFYDFERMELRGKKIGIIGMGKVGSRVAKYANAFEMEILANDIDKNVRRKFKEYKFKSLNFILKNADIVTIHIPLNNYNKGYFTKKRLNLLNNRSILINTSRGDIIDEKILLTLLKNNKIYYAGLDVFKKEPEINKLFFGLKNAILTNHIAGKTIESNKFISNDIFMQVKKYLLKK
jgi:D-3-phosphoglycerate dehydrogenase / 2-oxoglutarate reductase